MGINDRRRKIRRQAWTAFALIVGSAVALAWASGFAHLRWDLTEDKRYSLSATTKAVLASLDEPVTVEAYLTPDLPQPYGRLARFITDMLAAYHDLAGDKFQYRVINPDRDAEAQATLMALRVPKVQVQAIERDRAQIKQGYLALVLRYLDRTETIPVVQSEEGFEYLLTRKIKRLTGKGKHKLAVITGFGAKPSFELGALKELVADDYDVEDVDLDRDPMPEGVDVALVAAPTRPPSKRWRWRLQQFWLHGGGLLVLASRVRPLPGFRVVPADPYAEDWLREDYHLIVDPGLVMDEQAGRIVVEQRQGRILLRSIVDYPFLVVATNLDPMHPLTKGLGALSLLYASPLEWEEGETSHRFVLARTSAKAAVQDGPPFDVDPLMPLEARFQGLHRRQAALVLAGDGPAEATLARPKDVKDEIAPVRRAADARIVVVGSAEAFSDEFLREDNLLFALNALDWLARDEALIALRSKGAHLRVLPALDEEAKAFWKAIWMLGPPFVVIAFGLWRWRRLRARARSA